VLNSGRLEDAYACDIDHGPHVEIDSEKPQSISLVNVLARRFRLCAIFVLSNPYPCREKGVATA